MNRRIIFGRRVCVLCAALLSFATAHGAWTRPALGQAVWTAHMLGVDTTNRQAEVQAAVKDRPTVTVAFANSSSTDSHDAGMKSELKQVAEQLGVSVKVVQVSLATTGGDLKTVYEEAARTGDIVVDYRSYWNDGQNSLAGAVVEANPDKLFILPYAQINGDECPATKWSFQAKSMKADGTGLTNLVTTIPLAHTFGGKLMHPLRREGKGDTETATFVTPSGWAPGTGETCPSAAATAAVAAWVFAAHGQRPTAREIVRIMTEGARLPAVSEEAEFPETALTKLKSEIKLLTTLDDQGRKQLLTDGVVNAYGALEVLRGSGTELEIGGDITRGKDFASAEVTVKARAWKGGEPSTDAQVTVTLTPEDGGTPAVKTFDVPGDSDEHRATLTFEGLTAGRRYHVEARITRPGVDDLVRTTDFIAAREDAWFDESAETFPDNARWHDDTDSATVEDGAIRCQTDLGGSVDFRPESPTQKTQRIVIRARLQAGLPFDELPTSDARAGFCTMRETDGRTELAVLAGGAWQRTGHAVEIGRDIVLEAAVDENAHAIGYFLVADNGVRTEIGRYDLPAAKKAIGEISFSGEIDVVRLSGKAYDANLVRAANGREYADFGAARAAGATEPLSPLWASTWTLADGFGSVLVSDPDGLVTYAGTARVLRGEPEGAGGAVRQWYGPVSEAEMASGAGKYVKTAAALGLSKAITDESKVVLDGLTFENGELAFEVRIDGADVTSAAAALVETCGRLEAENWTSADGAEAAGGKIRLPSGGGSGFARVRIRED